jgi:hypothetical protein
MRNKTFKRMISEKEIMGICTTVYGEQMKNNTFTDMFNYSDEVRTIVKDKLQLDDKYDELRLDSYVTSIILYIFNM